MPRLLTIALITSLCLTCTARAEDKPLPATKLILEKAVREVRKNRQAFDKANEKPLGTARQELQDLSTKLIKDGKTAEAQAVLRQVDTLDADVLKSANAPPPVAGGVVPQKPLLERLEGKWTHPNSTGLVAFEKNGKTTTFWKSGSVNADGTARLLSEEEVEVRFSNQTVHRYRLIDSGLMVERVLKPDGSESGEGYLKMRVE